jgi:hypothetical protein
MVAPLAKAFLMISISPGARTRRGMTTPRIRSHTRDKTRRLPGTVVVFSKIILIAFAIVKRP